MASVSFRIPITFGNYPKSCCQSFLEMIDSYFYHGGTKATVIPGHTQQGSEGVVLSYERSSSWTTALKVVTYFTIVIPLIVLIIKAVARSIHSFYIINVRQKLEEGMNIPPDTVAKIREVMPKVIAKREDPAIVWYASGNNLVFGIPSLPQYVFKMAHPHNSAFRGGRQLTPEMIPHERFANMEYAKAVCMSHRLDLVVIPSAMKLDIDGTTIIAEEWLPVHRDESVQEQLYQLPGLDETVKQLATFIAVTGFSDVEWRNIPILDAAPDFHGSRRVALIDLEEMDGGVTGIFGIGSHRRGLINCLSSSAQMDSVVAVAARHGVARRDNVDAIKAERLEAVESGKQLQQFYAQRGIIENPRKPIQIDDLTTLGLNLDEQDQICTDIGEYKPITMRKVVEDVIAGINAEIAKTPEDASVNGKRYILLKTREQPLLSYLHLGVPKVDRYLMTPEQESKLLWINRIIDALIAKGHLFKLDKFNGYGHFLQA